MKTYITEHKQTKECKFRINEYKDYFTISKLIEEPIYFLGIRHSWLHVGVEERWRILLKNGQELTIRDIILPEKYRFKTKEECIEWIENYKKYPTYHYL